MEEQLNELRRNAYQVTMLMCDSCRDVIFKSKAWDVHLIQDAYNEGWRFREHPLGNCIQCPRCSGVAAEKELARENRFEELVQIAKAKLKKG